MRKAKSMALAAALLLACTSRVDNGVDNCQPDDADGVVGGEVTFDLTVDDHGFSPTILTAQNLSRVTLTLSNAGTRDHDFVVDCIPTPNENGCPTTSCFPDDAKIAAVAPGASAVAHFVVPNPEGIYAYHSSLAGDAPATCTAGASGCGQFIVK